MRLCTVSLAGLVIVALAGPVSAQAVLYQGTVNQSNAPVWCRPATGTGIYHTNELSQGSVVQVVQDLGNGWLAIMPPPGSFSWINRREVQFNQFRNNPDTLVAWAGDNVTRVNVFVGSDITPATRGTVLSVQLAPGTQVHHVKRPDVKDDNGDWTPIEAPYTEMRYIRVEMVTKSAPGMIVQNPVQAYPAVNSGPSSMFNTVATQPPGYQPAPFPGAIPTRPPVSDAQQLWQRAQQAERTGNINEAMQLYSQLASQTSGPDNALAMQGLNRAYWLREAQRNVAASTIPPVQPQPLQATPASQVRYGGNQAGNPAVAYAPPVPGGTPAPASAGQQPSGPVPSSTPSAPWQPVSNEGYLSSGPGWLRHSGRLLESRKAYVLESTGNYPRLYVTPQAGLDLDQYVGHYVELIGPAIYRGDLRANYMTVVRVQQLQ